MPDTGGRQEGVRPYLWTLREFARVLWQGGGKDEGRKVKDERKTARPSSFILHPSAFILS